MSNKAFEVLLPGETEGGIVAAETAGKARYIGYLGALDANYDLPITKFRVRRAPHFDRWAQFEERVHTCYTQEYVRIRMEVRDVS